MTKKPTNPSGSGPGGAHFEAKVGGYYLLTLLMDAEPRGLPGARVKRVQLQGSADGFPLDDVIVHGELASGAFAVAEIQVKRAITFSPGDVVFSKVAEEIAEAVKGGRLNSPNPYVMAIATAQMSRQIDGPYQEVLLWARDSERAVSFFRRLNHVGVSSDGMRTFVSTLRSHVAQFGAQSDDETIWKILRKLKILVFDFLAAQGQSEALVRDRCAQALDPIERPKAGALWSTLCDIALEIATHGGEISAETLRETLTRTHGFKLAGLRQNHAARAILFEASQKALQDIRDQVGNVKLARHAWLEIVNASLDGGGYVEIRGDAGVGKSGILRALAEQAAIEANIIVLSPIRTIPRGWMAMRSVLGFDGSARNLLTDVAASGGAILFLDGVDYFGDAERATANDLIREAAAIPGFKVVVTARRSFGIDEPNWLATDALDKLGRAPIVTIGELTDDEIKELRGAAPELAPLLADGHPAREVVRNLFRLDRLVQQGQSASALRTEADMARLWWRTGDGKPDTQTRDRVRILRDLAEKLLPGHVGPLDTSQYLTSPLEALVKSGTLRDLEGDKMIFRHDVFRDWAIANLLHENTAKISALPLSRPAPASLFRGVELAARLAIEGSTDIETWKTLLNTLSQPGVHGSWRRAVVVALVRSEQSPDILSRAESALVAEQGKLLREIVRTLMALEVKPAGELLAGAGIALPDEVAGLAMPVGPAWRRLIEWILPMADRLPATVIPDVAELFTSYAAAMWPLDSIVPSLVAQSLVPDLVAQLHAWLMELEGARVDDGSTRLPSFSAELDYDRRDSLRDYLRSSFLAFSTINPALAEQYVGFLLQAGRTAERSAEEVIRSPGNLARAAPKALVDLTANTLIEGPRPRRGGMVDHDEPSAFSHADLQFLSPSPARGPFLELLVHSPKDGLALVRRLVIHACTFDNRNRSAANDDAVTIELETGPRRFPYIQSYYWSRDARHYCVSSALMALEAWAHLRIDAGDSVDTVIADIIGDHEVATAYLLVVVDLILSHWPDSRAAGVPFVGSPELLAWDRSRQSHDHTGFTFDLFGEKEPRGRANLENLRQRASRQRMLEETLPYYLFTGPQVDADALRDRLERAKSKLGTYEAHADFGFPEFMVQSALNHLDRRNYQTQTIKDDNGNDQTALVYVSPRGEADHLAALQSRSAAHMYGANLHAEVSLALDDPSRSSIDLVGRAVAWAKETERHGEVQKDFDQATLIAAMLLMRDGDDAQRTEHGAWALEKFQAAAKQVENRVHRMRDGLRFNPVGIATAGMVLAIVHGQGIGHARPLLDLAVKGDPAAAHGFGVTLGALAAIDPRLPKVVLRCALTGNIRIHLKRYDAKGDEYAVRQRQLSERRERIVEAEWRWLQGSGPEPVWPDFPKPRQNRSEPMYFGATPRKRHPRFQAEAQFYADHQAAAVWLSKSLGNELVAPEWLRSVAHHYRAWTSKLNGAGLDAEIELSTSPREWNAAYYRLVACSLSGLDAAVMDELCVAPVVCLPDEPFLDVVGNLLLCLDVVYFDGKGVAEPDLVRIRTKMVERLKQTSQWRRFANKPGYGLPSHLDRALGAIFLNQTGFRTVPKCYVTKVGIPRVAPFIPLLARLAVETPSLFVVLAVLSTVSVSPEYPFIAYGVETVHACMTAYPDDAKLWIDYGVGKIFCDWLAGIMRKDGLACFDREGVRDAVEQLLSHLIRLGVPEANRLEVAFSGAGNA